MSSRASRAGGKFAGNHTNVIPAAAIVCDLANRQPLVTRISPGFIKAGLRSVGGKRRVKFTPVPGGIHVSVRDNTSHQEVYVYTKSVDVIIRILEEGSIAAGLAVTAIKP